MGEPGMEGHEPGDLGDMPPEAVEHLNELGSQLAGEMTPEQVQEVFNTWIEGLPEGAPLEEIRQGFQENFDAWVADGAPPFPPDGLTAEEIMGRGEPAEGMEHGPGEMGPGMEGMEGHVPPPHPTGFVNPFIEPLFEGAPAGAEGEPAWGLNYNEANPAESTWTLPLSPDQVDLEGGHIVIPGDMVGDPTNLPPEATDNGDGTYTINTWPISNMADNGDGTITLTVDIGPPPTAPPA
ncbi:MAG: hypothetical protein AB1916_14090 [Thermodesulfobacteriota bacterium]